MFEEIKNLKDSSKDSLKDTSSVLARPGGGPASLVSPWQKHIGSYTKTNKLISALYMVTDIMDKDDPLRNKLRTLGLELISDIHTNLLQTESRIHELMSFLDIASAINLISEMNANILKKEFTELKESIGGYLENSHQVLPTSLSEFLREDSKGHEQSLVSFKGQRTRIGVQKGSTLMNALSKMSDRSTHTNEGFNILKAERRNEIINAVKNSPHGLSIKDISTAIKNPNLSEKTLQRELVSMVKDNILNKVGSKRWTKYSIKG